MVAYSVGQSVSVTGVFTDQGGTIANPTTVTFRTTSPGGSVVLGTFPADTRITNPGTGTFVALFTLATAGDWVYRWQGTTGSYTPTAFGTITAHPTFSYGGDPSTSNRDALRFLIGDTDGTAVLLRDSELDWLLAQRGGVYQAAVQACKTLAARFARQVDSQVDDVRVSASQRVKQFRELAKQLERDAVLYAGGSAYGSVMPYVGGISQADKDTRAEDTDRVEPFFTRSWASVSGETLYVDAADD